MTTDAPTPPARPPFARADWLLAAALAAATLLVYAQVRSFGTVDLDDRQYVADNPYVVRGLTWAGVRWGLTGNVVGNWHPLTMWVEMALASAFGPTPATFHTANAVLHAAAVGLLFAVLRTATGRRWPAVAAAALWGFHPLRVESVAWMAELKDVLCGALWLACVLAHGAYARGGRRPPAYAAAVALGVLALLAKPMAVTLPFALLLLDAWPLGHDRPPAHATRWWAARVAEKTPLFVASAVAVVIGVRERGSLPAAVQIPLATRLANVPASVLAYLRDTVAPVDLGLFHPHPWIVHRPVPPAAVVGGLGLTVGLTAVAVVAARRRPYLAVGWLWFLGVLVPTLGLFQAGEQARADRFTYLPSVGLAVAVVWLVADWVAAAPRRRRTAAVGLAVAAVVAATVATVRLLPNWRDTEHVFARADAVIPDNYLAEAKLADVAADAGRLPEAESLARAAVAAADGRAALPHVALGTVLARERRWTPALAAFTDAILISPGDPDPRYRAALVLLQLDRRPAAIEQLERVVRLAPTPTGPRSTLAVELARAGRYADAAEQFRQLAVLLPGSPDVDGNRADALRLAGDVPGATAAYADAVRHGTDNPRWQAELAWLTAGDPASTVDQLRFAEPPARQAAGRPDAGPFPPYALSVVQARLGRFDDATASAILALGRATAPAQAAMATDIRRRLNAYRAGQVGGGGAVTPPPAATAPAR